MEGNNNGCLQFNSPMFKHNNQLSVNIKCGICIHLGNQLITDTIVLGWSLIRRLSNFFRSLSKFVLCQFGSNRTMWSAIPNERNVISKIHLIVFFLSSRCTWVLIIPFNFYHFPLLERSQENEVTSFFTLIPQTATTLSAVQCHLVYSTVI